VCPFTDVCDDLCRTCERSPDAPFIATGTMAGAIDLSFSTTACLEIFETNYASEDLEMPVVGRAVPATERFHRLVWGTCGSETSEEMRLGVIAGGLVDGTVNVYNPAKIVDGAQSGAIITKLAKHQGAVRGLDFNSFSPNLLASGAEDGELCIWDLANPTKPSLYPALKSGSGGPTAGEVSSLAWNHKVQHILASSSLSGTTVVWDLKRQRPVISFTDPNSRRRCSALQWNPEVATQLIVASDDDRSCSLQVWDLRNSISPAREFVAHSKGVLAMAWNLQDPSLLLTCGKDNRTLCWDTEAGEVISELPASSNWNFDVQWSKTTPGILSTSSFDGKITLHNLQQAGAPQAAGGQAHGVASDFSGLSHAQSAGPKVAMKRAPEWMKRPCGATFGFGGKLIAHGASLSGALSSPTAISVISVKSDSSEPGVADEVRGEFEKVIKSGETDELINFCNTKRADAPAEDKEAWTFMSILFTEDARREMLRHLEFGDALEAREKSMAALSLNDASAGADEDEHDTASSAPTSPALMTPVEDNDAFFDNLGDEAPKPPPPKVLPKPKASPVKPKSPASAQAPPPEAADFEIQRALIVGDYRAAVAACEKAGRYADALILAAAGGPDLWAEAQAAHIARVPRPYMQVAAAVVGKNLSNLVKARPVSAWRETLAMLCTYAPGEEWGPLAEVLAEGLASSGDHRAAMLCHICAGNVDAAIKYWLSSLPSRNFAPKDLYDVVEKAVMLTRAAGQTESTQGFTSLITNYAEMLSSQGDLDHALDYLGMVPGVPGEEVNVLRNRIIRSGISNPATTSAPATPPARMSQPAPYQQQQQQSYQQPPQQQQQSPYAQSPQANAYSAQTTSYGAPPVPQRAPQSTPMMPAAYAPQQDMHSNYGGMPQQSAYGAPPPPAQAQQQQQPLPPPPRQTAYDSAPVQSAYSAQASYPSAQAPMQASGPGMTPAYSVAAAVAAGTMGASQPAYGAGPSQPPQGAPMMPGMMVPTPMQSQQQQYQQGGMGGAPPQQQQQRAPPPPPTATPQAAMFNPTPTAPPPSIPQRPAEPPAYGSSAPPPPPSQSYSSAPPPPQQQPTYGHAPPPQSAFSPQVPMGMTPTPQPLAPTQPQQQAPPPRPAAPAKPQPPANCTMENVDTSKVSGDLAAITTSLRAMYDVCAQAAGGNPAKRKEMEDSSKRLAVLLFKANIGEVSSSVTEKLKSLAQALDMADYQSAQNIQMALTTGDWDECSFWLTALKRLLKFRSTLP
jgi:protein transport protein SEC31